MRLRAFAAASERKRKPMNWKSTRAILAASAMGITAAALSNFVVLAPAHAAAAIITKNEALVKAIKDAQSAAAAQRWADALAAAKAADAIKEDKPAQLNVSIHEMIVSYAANAKDYAAAMAQLDKNIAAGEGNEQQSLDGACHRDYRKRQGENRSVCEGNGHQSRQRDTPVYRQPD